MGERSVLWSMKADQDDLWAHAEPLVDCFAEVVDAYGTGPLPDHLVGVDTDDIVAVSAALDAHHRLDDETPGWDAVDSLACRRWGCDCPYFYVEMILDDSADRFDEALGELGDPSWWYEGHDGYARPLDTTGCSTRSGLRTVLSTVHRGRGFTACEVTVYDDATMDVTADGGHVHAVSLTGVREAFADEADPTWADVLALRRANDTAVRIAWTLWDERDDDGDLADYIDAAACVAV